MDPSIILSVLYGTGELVLALPEPGPHHAVMPRQTKKEALELSSAHHSEELGVKSVKNTTDSMGTANLVETADSSMSAVHVGTHTP